MSMQWVCNSALKLNLLKKQQNLSFTKEETRNYNMRYIRSLFSGNDILISDPKLILEEEERFYKQLYTKPEKQIINPELFDNKHIPKLTEESVEICHMTIEEFGEALKQLPNRKSPGTDGLTSEFYKFFWPHIKQMFLIA